MIGIQAREYETNHNWIDNDWEFSKNSKIIKSQILEALRGLRRIRENNTPRNTILKSKGSNYIFRV